VVISVVICYRLQDSRIGRAWMAIREDEIAAKAMGINTRNMKLLAFGMGATFGGVAGAMFAGLPGLRLARVLQPDGVVMIVAMVVLGGMGHLPGRDPGRRAAVGPARGAALCGWPAAGHDRWPPRRAILRQLLIALAMIIIMLLRPRGLWPAPEHGKSLTQKT
jgi:branched-chain amino acid transport system permease protein